MKTVTITEHDFRKLLTIAWAMEDSGMDNYEDFLLEMDEVLINEDLADVVEDSEFENHGC